MLSMGARRIFSRGGQIKGSGGWKLPSMVQGRNPGGGLGVKPPEADDIVLKIVHKYFVY